MNIEFMKPKDKFLDLHIIDGKVKLQPHISKTTIKYLDAIKSPK
jgi:hypothetical protein